MVLLSQWVGETFMERTGWPDFFQLPCRIVVFTESFGVLDSSEVHFPLNLWHCLIVAVVHPTVRLKVSTGTSGCGQEISALHMWSTSSISITISGVTASAKHEWLTQDSITTTRRTGKLQTIISTWHCLAELVSWETRTDATGKRVAAATVFPWDFLISPCHRRKTVRCLGPTKELKNVWFLRFL